MAIDEKEFIEIDAQYHTGVGIDRYKGISLVSARMSVKDGKIYSDWAFLQNRDKTPKDKAVPVKVYLGEDESEAIETMRKVAMVLKGK